MLPEVLAAGVASPSTAVAEAVAAGTSAAGTGEKPPTGGPPAAALDSEPTPKGNQMGLKLGEKSLPIYPHHKIEKIVNFGEKSLLANSFFPLLPKFGEKSLQDLSIRKAAVNSDQVGTTANHQRA
jgi:hypothetical protein